MPTDTKTGHNQQQDMDFLRGACHAIAALDNPQLKMRDALEAVQFLRGKAAGNRPIPPLMWFLGYVSIGKKPAEVYEKFIQEERIHA